MIADDNAFSSGGLQRLLEERGHDVLPPVVNGIAAIALARQKKPTLAVLDYEMPGANGLEVMREIRRWSPETRVAILTGRAAPALLNSLEAAGIDGLFVKATPPEQIYAGLLKVIAGERVIGIAHSDDIGVVSRRELQILECIAEGLSNPATGERLSISAKTVESHRANLMRKLNVRSTASLIIEAVRVGLISVR